MLDVERAYYQKMHGDLLSKYPGQIVVIKGQEVIGLFHTIQEALTGGARRFGMQVFLVREIADSPRVSIPALSLGLLRADSPFSNQRPTPDA